MNFLSTLVLLVGIGSEEAPKVESTKTLFQTCQTAMESGYKDAGKTYQGSITDFCTKITTK